MRRGLVLGGVAGLMAALAVPASADFFDSFHDMKWLDDSNWVVSTPIPWGIDPNAYDPNNFDIDNANWQVWWLPFGTAHTQMVNEDGLNLSVKPSFLVGIIAASVNYPPYSTYPLPDMNQDPNDPNNNPGFWRNEVSHYLMAFVKIIDPNASDPNHEYNGGESALGLHVNPDNWFGMWLGTSPSGWLYMHSAENNNPIKWTGADVLRTDLDRENGFWMLLQYDAGGEPFDPNNARWRAAAWNGTKADKFAWDGEWDLISRFSDGWPLLPYESDWDPNWYNPSALERGIDALLTYTLKNDPVAWGAFDNVEARTGIFTNVSHTLSLNVKNANMGTLTIDPDLIDDPNDDPNDPEVLRRYTDGTEIVLVAEPGSNASFKSWTIFDPNYPGDREHASEDSNSVLYLTMNMDYEIEAAFKCGSSKMLPPVGMVLLALVIGIVIRRLS